MDEEEYEIVRENRVRTARRIGRFLAIFPIAYLFIFISTCLILYHITRILETFAITSPSVFPARILVGFYYGPIFAAFFGLFGAFVAALRYSNLNFQPSARFFRFLAFGIFLIIV